ncbi:MAG TPA: hypothetical protein VMU34_24320 [Mycobacterium sp.]|nr:hypothetical protein [Mycobacterium sp.]
MGVPDVEILTLTDMVDCVWRMCDAVDRAVVALEAAETIDQMRQIPKLVSRPTLANMIPGGKTPVLPAAEFETIGFAAVAWPNAFTYAYAKVAGDFAKGLLRTGSTAGYDDKMIEFEEFNRLVGLPKIRAAEEHYYSEVKDPHLRGA